MKNVLIRGPLLSLSGYGFHCRQVFSWLLTREDIKIHCQILPWGTTTWLINRDLENGLIGQILDRVIPENQVTKQKFDESYQIQLPNEWINVSSKDIGITAGIETTVCNPEWLHHINRMNKVIVPSTFAKEVFIDTAKSLNFKLQTDICVIPEYFHEDLEKQTENQNIKEQLDNIGQDINFLIVSQFTGADSETDRKNLLSTIKNTVEILSKKPGKTYSIVLKTNLGKSTTLDFMRIKKLFKGFIDSLNYNKESIKIHILHGDLESKDLSVLYNHPNIHCYLTCTRGEGYGLPILEAASQGLPIIATNWSGHLDFLKGTNFIPLDYKLNDVHQSKIDNKIFVKGAQWADFIPESLSEALNKFIKKKNKYRKEAQKDSKMIMEKFCKESILKQYDEHLLG